MAKTTKITVIPFDQVDDKQIAKWKELWGDIWQVDCEGHSWIFRKPSRKVLSLAMRLADKDAMKFNETIIDNCMLAGDKDILAEDDDLFMGVSNTLDKLVQYKEADIKKL